MAERPADCWGVRGNSHATGRPGVGFGRLATAGMGHLQLGQVVSFRPARRSTGPHPGTNEDQDVTAVGASVKHHSEPGNVADPAVQVRVD